MKFALVFVSYFNEVDIKDNLRIFFENHRRISCDLQIIIVETGGNIASIMSEIPEEASKRLKVLAGPKKIVGHPAPGSRQHADSLDLAYSYCLSEGFSYVCFCDPDLVVTASNWIEEFVAEMKSKSAPILGVPYFPIYYSKYRYFPTVMFVVLELDFFKKINIKFSDQIQLGIGRFAKPAGSSYWKTVRDRLPVFLRMITLSRLKVGKSRDTGYEFYSQCISMGLRYVSLKPLVLHSQFPFEFNYFKYAIIRIIDALVYEKYAIFPKEKGSYEILDDNVNLKYDPDFEHYSLNGRSVVYHRRSSLKGSKKSLMAYYKTRG